MFSTSDFEIDSSNSLRLCDKLSFFVRMYIIRASRLALLMLGSSTFIKSLASFPVNKNSRAEPDAVFQEPGIKSAEVSLAMSFCFMKKRCKIERHVRVCVFPFSEERILCSLLMPINFKRASLILFLVLEPTP